MFFLSAFPVFAQPSDCSTNGQNFFVRDVLRAFYLWYREMPNTSPALFDSPEAYLDAVRYLPLDQSFSYIAPKATTEAFYSNSQFIGIGFSQKLIGKTSLRISQVFPDSPASEAGLRRGDYLLVINGRRVEDILATRELGSIYGPSEIGGRVELSWRAGTEERSAIVTKRLVTIPTVSQTKVFDLDGRIVGYLHFRNFVEPSVVALDAAFANFRATGVQDLILDLRYNGGGLISVAQHLAGLIAGVRTNTKVFVEFFHNDKQTERNRVSRFADPMEALDLPRVVVITSGASASASELVINGLRPFIPVTIIGERTYGKPVGQYSFNFCEKVVFPVSFETRNAMGAANYFNGFPPDCPAGDGLNRPLAHPEENSLAEALTFLRTDACSQSSTLSARSSVLQRIETRVFSPKGFRQLINAW